jgi:hypothetical protein
MAANTAPIFTKVPNVGLGQISAANTNRDGTGTLVSIFTAGSEGSYIEGCVITATVTTTAGMVRFYAYDGSNNRLILEVPVTAITPSGTVAAFTATPTLFDGFPLPTGWIIKASTHNAETFNIIMKGGNY